MKNILAGLLLIAICVAGISAGMGFGHDNPAMLALIPIGVGCGVGGGFLLAQGGRG